MKSTVEKRPSPLPGWVVLFQIQLVLGVLAAAWGITVCLRIMADFRYMESGLRTAFWLTILVYAIFICLQGTAFFAVWRRSPTAPRRCRQVMGAVIGLCAFLALAVWGLWVQEMLRYDDMSLDMFMRFYTESLFGSFFFDLPSIPLVRLFLLSTVSSVAWYLYFGNSERVRQTFIPRASIEGMEDAPSMGEKAVSTRISRPTEAAFFGIWCGCLLANALTVGPAILYHNMLSPITFGVDEPLWWFLVACDLLLPLAGLVLFFLRKRWGLALMAFLWAALCLSENLLSLWARQGYIVRDVMDRLDFYGFAATPGVVIGLVFCWYFLTSEKAKAYFSSGQTAAPREEGA